MAAPEIPFEALGQAWRFKFGWGALCRLEDRYDQPFARILLQLFPELSIEDLGDEEKILNAAMDLRASLVRDVMAAGTGGDITDAMAEEMIDELGPERVMDIIRQAAAKDTAGGSARPAPKKAAARRPSRRG